MKPGSTLLVTGATRGIGAAISRRLLKEGHKVLGVSREPGGKKLGDNFTWIGLDLGDPEALPYALKHIGTEHPEIDGVILSAGQGKFGAIEQFSADDVQQLINLNFTAQALMAREFLPRLKRKGSGTMIFIGSEAALSGGKNGAVYSATKFALRGLTQSLQEECSSSGVRVGIINPGMVNTGFFDQLTFRPGSEPDQHLLPEDVADAVMLMLNARDGATIQEINLQPQKKVIQFEKN